MKYADLRDFLAQLEQRGELKRIAGRGRPAARDDRDLRPRAQGGRPGAAVREAEGPSMPVLGNLFGTPQRVAMGMGEDSVAALREIGKLLAFLKEPEPPKGLKDAWQNTRPLFMQVLHMAPKERSGAPCQEIVWEGADVDLARLPVQTCWPGDAGAARHVGPHRHARAAQGAAEPRHLPAAGDRARTSSSCAGSTRAAARSTSAIMRSRIRARRFRSRSRSAPTRRRSSAR